ncbi:hypothetical protein CYLTODRAFT_339733, partial [Cylindrobasidium torrendii FP15055 ss-10]
VAGLLHRHAVACYGQEVVDAVQATKDQEKAGEIIKKYGTKKANKLTNMLKGIRAPKESYSTIPPGKMDVRRPFSIVEDKGLRWIAKEGRPHYYLPDRTTISRDTKTVFVKSEEALGKMLQEHDGLLAFSTDCWSAPNHHAWMSLNVHITPKGQSKPKTFLLDFIELPCSHTGTNMAQAF